MKIIYLSDLKIPPLTKIMHYKPTFLIIKNPRYSNSRLNCYSKQQYQFQSLYLSIKTDFHQVKYKNKLKLPLNIISKLKKFNISEVTNSFLTKQSPHQNPTVIVTKEPIFALSILSQYSSTKSNNIRHWKLHQLF